MSKSRNDACLKINAISNNIANLRERVKYDGLPTHKISESLVDIGHEINELFWMVDGIKTAEDLAEELVRTSRELRGLR